VPGTTHLHLLFHAFRQRSFVRVLRESVLADEGVTNRTNKKFVAWFNIFGERGRRYEQSNGTQVPTDY
jgi:hypothetical protein